MQLNRGLSALCGKWHVSVFAVLHAYRTTTRPKTRTTMNAIIDEVCVSVSWIVVFWHEHLRLHCCALLQQRQIAQDYKVHGAWRDLHLVYTGQPLPEEYCVASNDINSAYLRSLRLDGNSATFTRLGTYMHQMLELDYFTVCSSFWLHVRFALHVHKALYTTVINGLPNSLASLTAGVQR